MLDQDQKDNNLIHDDEEINRLKDKFFKDNDLSDLEFIELLLTYSTRARKNRKEIARKLLRTYGSVVNILATPTDELINVDSIDPETATLISLVKACCLKIEWEYLE